MKAVPEGPHEDGVLFGPMRTLRWRGLAGSVEDQRSRRFRNSPASAITTPPSG